MDISTIINDSFSAALGPIAIVYALGAIGLNIQFGYTGLLNFGQAGFMAVGAYGLSVSVVTYGIPFGLALIIALVLPLILAIILGVPTLRLRADYLAIATIAASEIIRLVISANELKDVTGATQGLTGYAGSFYDLNPYSKGLDIGIASFSAGRLWAMTVGWVVVAIVCVLVWLLMRSPWGRVLRSIREDEDAVRSLGKNVFAYKMQSLMLGGFLGGVAGIFYALQQSSALPGNYNTSITFYLYTALLLGGAARVLGPVVGAMIFWFLLNGIGTVMSQLTAGDDPIIPSGILDSSQGSLVRFVLVGFGLMLLMIFRPQGIFGDRKELAIDGR